MIDVGLVGFAFSAGALTFFAPCAYPLLPGYVSYYLGAGTAADAPDRSLLHAAGVGLVVSAGFVLVYGVLAGVVAAVGAGLLSNISVLELVVGVLLIALGIPMAAGWKPAMTVQLPERRRSVAGFFGFGVLYAMAAAGCTAPVFIAVALKALSGGPAASVAAFGAYAAGMGVLMVGVTVATALGRDALVRRLSRRAGLLHRLAGVGLVVAGIVQLYFFLFRFQGLELLGLA